MSRESRRWMSRLGLDRRVRSVRSSAVGFCFGLLLLAASAAGVISAVPSCRAATTAAAQTPVCGYVVVNAYPHDDQAFTQGLLFSDGQLFESTGLWGQSSLRRVALETGQVQQIRELDPVYFGEGLALWQDRLIQLTFEEHTGLIWDAVTFAPIGTFAYAGQGWGLTHDDRRLIMSDGTSVLRVLDPDTYLQLASVAVTDDGSPVDHLNELEWIRGEVFANRWLTDFIARIDPDTGEVIAWIDLAGLLDPVPPGAQVLNGIAWDDAGERLFVTGKYWPTLFEIVLVGCPELRLYGDGFESGGTVRWSLIVP